MRFIIALILNSLLFFGSYAQDIPPDTTLTKKQLKKAYKSSANVFYCFGTSYSMDYALDKQVSPLIYQGFGTGAYISQLTRLPKKISRLDLSITKTALTNKWAEDDDLPSGGMNYRSNSGNYYHFRKIFNGTGNWYLGYCSNFQLNARLNPRFMNSGLSYDLFYNVGPATHIEKDFTLKQRRIKIWFLKFNRKERNLRLAWQVELPVLNLITRPNYTAMFNDGNGKPVEAVGDAIIKNTKLTSFNNFYMITSRLELYYKLANNNNMIRLAYIWQAYSYYRPLYEVQAVSSGLYLSFLFKLDKNKNF